MTVVTLNSALIVLFFLWWISILILLHQIWKILYWNKQFLISRGAQKEYPDHKHKQ